MATPMPRRFYSLDLLRGLAALAVVFWHWQHFFFAGSHFVPYEMQAQPFYGQFYLAYEAGWLAVDLFFSLSGFVFFWLYAEAIAARRVGPWSFFVLRFSRLYPLHLLSFLLVLGMQHWLRASSGDYFVMPYNDAYHALLNLLLVSGWGLEAGPSFNGPIWSVSVEVLMYLLFFLACRLFGLRLSVNIALVLAGLALMAVHPILGRGLFSFFLGGLVFRGYRELCQRQLACRAAPLAVGAAALCWLVTLLEVRTPWLFPGLETLLAAHLPQALAAHLPSALHGLSRLLPVALLFPLTILALALAETRRGHLGRRLARIGDLSYASYLLHFPLQLALFIAARQLGIVAEAFYDPLALLLFFALLIPLCLLSYRHFERPAQDALRRLLLDPTRRADASRPPAPPRGRTMTRKTPVAFVLLAHGFGASTWSRLFRAGKIIGLNEEYAYGYHHAEKHGVRVVYSEDGDEGPPGKLARLALRALLGFDLLHAWRNREAFFAADVVWTHTESLSLAAGLLCRLFPRRPAPRLILQSVWLCDRWDGFSRPRRWLYRALLADADILTFLSPLNQAKARDIFPDKRCELVRFGIAATCLEEPRAPAGGTRLRLLSLGNDRHRDWPTLVAAVRGQPQLDLTIVSGTIAPRLVAGLDNCRVVQPRRNDELEALFAEADLVIVPLVDNLHASGITVLEEAVIKGRPVIVSDTGGLRAYFGDEEVRYVAPDDPLALREAIAEVARDGERALARARAAQRRIGCPGLSSESFALQHAQLSLELLEDTAQPCPAPCSQGSTA